MRKRLRERLEPDLGLCKPVVVYNSFDVVGNIAIIKFPRYSQQEAHGIAQTVMNSNKGIKTVLLQQSKVSGKYRLRRLTWLAGEKKTCTVHKEHGCSFAVDLQHNYFSPRLSGERLRIARLVGAGEVIINMFAGVGCFSIVAAKRVPDAKVYSIDINPNAVKCMQENVRVNRVYGRVVPMLGDAKETIETQLQGTADRVLMPLPEKALEYLPCAVSALKQQGGWIHCHLFEHAAKSEDPVEKANGKVAVNLERADVNYTLPFSRVIRPIGPNWHHIVVDVQVW